MNAAGLLARMGAPLELDSYDWTTAAMTRVADEEVFQLTYAAHVEWGTEATFASLDVSTDPVVSQFLAIWLGQEVRHAELLTRLLASQGVSVEPRHRSRAQRFAARRERWMNQAALRVLGTDFLAVHMTWGAVNELTTLRFYTLLRRRTAHPLLREILGDVIAQEAIHFAFYRAMAIDLLRDNRRAQRITRWVMTHLWSPVGAGLRSRSDADRLMQGVFADEPSEIEFIDARIARLPGLAGLDLVRGVVAGVVRAA